MYKFLLSILIGLLGFAVNFYPLRLDFPPHNVGFMFGLLFPLMVTLAWGWKYGLVSATLGLACQNGWFLWRGWAPVVSVPFLTLWVVWHGWCAERRRAGKTFRFNPYLVEIPFRIANTIVLYTLFRWVHQFNPPFWDPGMDQTSIPLAVVNVIAVKEAVNGYLVLVAADLLFNLRPVRRLFRLRKEESEVFTHYLVTGALLLGVVFWVTDAFLAYAVFHSGEGISWISWLWMYRPMKLTSASSSWGCVWWGESSPRAS